MRTQNSFAEDGPPFEHELADQLALLVRRDRSWLLAALRLRFGGDAAEDLVQETFLRAVRHAKLRDIRHPKAWLLTIALNAARDHLRRQASRPPFTDVGAPAPQKQLAVPSVQDQNLLLKQIILALPPHLRDVFVLNRFGGLTNEEIARRLGISIKTVEWRMTKALAICAARLRD